ncbi:hypothetical protein LELG_05685 [Lodderomyces elongisporus NRRL YB-4239]|uniref:Pre-rRNA-processing protein RIX1 n=1 Tax=Lodderomyces elongisporus (strain ATCC 11503 / CBS 2605 / JCM 1781 / NBRC 1676 / NRRL YB-4239) TaxID=379508 RepID=RIX1_LODEL|nr:RecName: Full=Pre-rRNA-processing protein RIX1 [Lodderomyces elongisporus NRRL YB-4239]EDK47504.1 hypothetical protein LELG_05685 [Lodderomyces elongisporus NRRL YB-4239]
MSIINIVLEGISENHSSQSIVPVLELLRNDKTILSNISKLQLQQLVSRSLQLVRSSDSYSKWCGINLIHQLSSNYVIVAQSGVQFMSALIAVLESYNSTINVLILRNCIECLQVLMHEIRGKPALTREILTPKLSTIITLVMGHIQFDAETCLNLLYDVILHHPNTFRPFANKLRSKLLVFLKGGFGVEFVEMPTSLRKIICQTMAILPIIEKNEPEAKWGNDVKNVISEVTGILNVFDEFFNFRDDSSLGKLISKLPGRGERAELGEGDRERVFDDLSIDFNEPRSLLAISDQVETLLQLLKHYLVGGGITSVRLPLGLCLTLLEVVFSINARFLSYKSDVRDDEIRQLISTVLNRVHTSGIELLSSLLQFRGALVPHLNQIWTMLEYLVPMIQNKRIDAAEVVKNEAVFAKLVECVGLYLNLVGAVSDGASLVPFVDVALTLVEPRKDSAGNMQQSAADGQQKNQNKNKNQKNKIKKKNASSAPMSDILSHEHLFQQTIPTQTLLAVQYFFSQVITKVELPSNQHYKTLRFIIRQCVEHKNSNLEQAVPKQLRDLLVNTVLYPGYDKNNALPIVSSILIDDPIISVFNNPRLPALPKYHSMSTSMDNKDVTEVGLEQTTYQRNRNGDDDHDDDDDDDDDDDEEVSASKGSGKKLSAKELAIQNLMREQAERQKLDREKEANARIEKDAEHEATPSFAFQMEKRPREEIVEEVGKVEKKIKVGEHGLVKDTVLKSTVETVVDNKNDVANVSKNDQAQDAVGADEDNEGSDFEIPEINMELDTDEEEEGEEAE